jgi:hypothetical protein
MKLDSMARIIRESVQELGMWSTAQTNFDIVRVGLVLKTLGQFPMVKAITLILVKTIDKEA